MEPELETAAPTEDALVRIGLVFYGVMALVAVVWRVGFYRESLFWASAASAELPLALLRDLALGLGVGLAIIAVSEVMTRATGWGERLARALAEPLASLSVPNALLLASASGLAEEMLFRGALQPRVGWLAASLLFGLVHFAPRRDLLPWTGFAILAGLVFGWLFDWTGNLLAPVAAHTVVNGVNLPRLIRRYGPGAPLPPDPTDSD